VNEHYDEGGIIFQAKTRLDPSDTAEDVAAKVHKLEYEHFPKVLENLILAH
jgi:phosphoribosylglycinamide formyltransferase-1